jgi:hypothetical protein
MTVGKRMDSEALIATHNTGIMAHQRSVNWAEREYMALHRKVGDMQGAISAACCVRTEDQVKQRRQGKLFCDYLNQATTNAHRQAGEDAVYEVWGGGKRKSHR